jgi:hypothetical protein
MSLHRLLKTNLPGVTKSRTFSHHYTHAPAYYRTIIDGNDFHTAVSDLKQKIRYLEHSIIEVKQDLVRLQVHHPDNVTVPQHDSEIYPKLDTSNPR